MEVSREESVTSLLQKHSHREQDERERGREGGTEKGEREMQRKRERGGGRERSREREMERDKDRERASMFFCPFIWSRLHFLLCFCKTRKYSNFDPATQVRNSRSVVPNLLLLAHPPERKKIAYPWFGTPNSNQSQKTNQSFL
jgi:hypothetical protein